MTRTRLLAISGREMPGQTPAWEHEAMYLLEAGTHSAKTESTYRSGLRLFADWLQHFHKGGYTLQDPWPLQADKIRTETVLAYRAWLIKNRAKATVNTYTAAVLGYLIFLDGLNQLPPHVQLGKLQRQLNRRKVERNIAEGVIDLDHVRAEAIPQIVNYYRQLPLPAENDQYNRRLSRLRDNAFIQTLYATAARLSEITNLNRTNVDYGRAEHATIVGKGNRPRTIYIRDYARSAIRAYLAERTDSNPALFISHSRNANKARLSTTSGHNIVKRAVKALNLHESLSAHDFRHFRATQLLREGMPIEVVQEYLGHADISTTRGIYAPVLGVQVVSEWLDNVDVTPEQLLSSLDD